MKLIKIIMFTLLGLIATACSEGKYGGMSNSELQEKQRHCDSIKKKSPVFASGCENVREEIQRRKKK